MTTTFPIDSTADEAVSRLRALADGRERRMDHPLEEDEVRAEVRRALVLATESGNRSLELVDQELRDARAANDLLESELTSVRQTLSHVLGDAAAESAASEERIRALNEHVARCVAAIKSLMAQVGAVDGVDQDDSEAWQKRIDGLPAMTLNEISAAQESAIKRLVAIGKSVDLLTIARMASLLLGPVEDVLDVLTEDG